MSQVVSHRINVDKKNHSFVAAVTFGQLGGRSYDMHTCFESQVTYITIFFRLILVKADKM